MNEVLAESSWLYFGESFENWRTQLQRTMFQIEHERLRTRKTSMMMNFEGKTPVVPKKGYLLSLCRFWNSAPESLSMWLEAFDQRESIIGLYRGWYWSLDYPREY
jgi:hypothetical protein